MVYVMYKDAAGYWRWRLFATNNKIVADSGEGYVNKTDCEHGINLCKASANATVRTQ
jgi:uncharacterized protein YegP (UPF0339 family)